MVKVNLRKSESKKKARKTKAKALVLTLPTEFNIPSQTLSDYSILIYGAKKIGKTALAARFPDVFIMSLEPGTKALRTKARRVPDWDHFVGYVDLLEAGGHGYKTVVVDTMDLAYKYALQKVCAADMIEHPSENNDFGKTWDRIKEMLYTQVMRLIDLDMGVIFLSHDKEKEVELRDGRTIDRIQPTMANGAMEVVSALVDIIANYAYIDDERILFLDGSQAMFGGCRCEENFIRKGGKAATAGDRITSVSMGKSSRESYDNLLTAFKNKQIKTSALQDENAPSLKKKKKITLKKKSSK